MHQSTSTRGMQVPLFGASLSEFPASSIKTVDEHDQLRDRNGDPDRERGSMKPAFTVRHAVVYLVGSTRYAASCRHAERVTQPDPTGCVVLR